MLSTAVRGHLTLSGEAFVPITRSKRSGLQAAMACLVAFVIVPQAVGAPAGFRALADGVLTVIPPNVAVGEMLIRDDLRTITDGHRDLAWTPKHAAAGSTFVALGAGREFPRELWCLEFAFKPPRTIDIDVPVAGLKMRRKRIWYLAYRVRNIAGESASGMRLKTDTADARADRSSREVERFDRPIRFVPHFVLESPEAVTDDEGLVLYRAYLDRLIPTALDAIRRREDPQIRFFDSAAMAATELQPGETRWGVATWEDIDPRIDFFSIYVTGLTNALQWRLVPGAEVTKDDPPNAKLEERLQSLRLDFWRPGDDREPALEQASIGFRGMFERMTLGGRLMDAAARPALNASQPGAGLDRLGLGWGDEGIDPLLLDPDVGADPTIPDWGSLRPLQTVIRAIIAMPDPAARGVAVRELFGDRGLDYLEALARELAGPVDPRREEERRVALEEVGLTPEKVAEGPLAAVADLLTAMESRSPTARRELAARLFGPEAGPWVGWLAREVTAARTLSALEQVGVPLRSVTEADALAAFDALRPAIEGVEDPDRRGLLLAALFGPRGPALFAEATAVHEGIDHAWVFRYEQE